MVAVKGAQLRAQLFKEFGEHSQNRWNEVKVLESKPDLYVPPVTPIDRTHRDFILPPNSRIHDDPPTPEELYNFLCNLPIAQTIVDSQTGELITMDQLKFRILQAQLSVRILNELDSADMADPLQLVKSLFDQRLHSKLRKPTLGLPTSITTLIASRLAGDKKYHVVLKPAGIKRFLETEMAHTYNALSQRLDSLNALVGIGASGSKCELAESCSRITAVLDYWACSSHLRVTTQGLKMIMDRQKDIEVEDTNAMLDQVRRTVKDRRKQEDQIINALYAEVEPAMKVDFRGLQKVAESWTTEAARELGEACERTQITMSKVRAHKLRLAAATELLAQLNQQVREHTAILDRLLKAC